MSGNDKNGENSIIMFPAFCVLVFPGGGGGFGDSDDGGGGTGGIPIHTMVDVDGDVDNLICCS